MADEVKITKVEGTPVQMSSDDVVILKPEYDRMYQQCCGCGLVHRIEVSPRTEEIRFRYVSVGHEFPLSEFNPETHVEYDAALRVREEAE